MRIVLLQVTAPHFVAGCVWEKRGEHWRCTRAAPIIKWLVGMTSTEAEQKMKRLGYTLERVTVRTQEGPA